MPPVKSEKGKAASLGDLIRPLSPATHPAGSAQPDVPLLCLSPCPPHAHLAQLLWVEGDDGHGVATAGGTNHELPPVSTFMEEDAGVQGGATDELLIALRGGEMAPLVP